MSTPNPAHAVEDAVADHDTLEVLARTIQAPVRAFEHALPDPIRSLLHGDFLGHPVHPILVHLPLGGWIVAAVLDYAPGADEGAADLALALGTLGGVGTVATGWADWAQSRGEARRTGLVHGLLNESALILNVGSLLARRRGRRGLGKALSGAALLISGAGAFLGGELVYRHGLGVGHTMSTPQRGGQA